MTLLTAAIAKEHIERFLARSTVDFSQALHDIADEKTVVVDAQGLGRILAVRAQNPDAALLDEHQVRARCGMTGAVGRALFRRMVKSGTFPQPVTLNVKARRWIATEIDDWVGARVRARTLAAAANNDERQQDLAPVPTS